MRKRTLFIAALSAIVVIGVVSVSIARRSDRSTVSIVRYKHAHPKLYRQTARPRAAILRMASASAAGDVLHDFPDLAGAKVAQASSETGEVLVQNPGADQTTLTAGQMCVAAYLTKSTPHAAPQACAPAADFNSQGIVATVGRPPNELLLGAVPDGVSSVTVTFADGATQQIAVVNNTFALHTATATSSVSFAGPSGTVTQSATPAPE